jgi:hypothetical protein
VKLLQLFTIALVHGYVSGALFRRLTSATAVRAATNRMVAHILEFRLFVDEPMLIFRAQRDLMAANFRLLREIALPSLLSAALLAAAWLPMDRYFGRSPLPIGEAAIVRAESTERGLDLVAPFGVAIESAALRVPGEQATLWRVRVLSPVTGNFRTIPVARRVTVPYPAGRYLGMPWVVFLAIVSGIAGIARMRHGARRGV